VTPAMIAALQDRTIPKTVLFQFSLPSGTRRLMLGSGETKWGANKFVGYDSSIGHIASGDDIRESIDGIAPNTSVSIIPANGVSRDAIAADTIQLSPITVWLAALTLDGSQHVTVVADPEPIFDGFLDQATISLDANTDQIDYTIISAFDYFFEDGEGQRLNGAFHTMIWPGELGLNNATGVTKKIYWGAYGPNQGGASTSGGGSFGGVGVGVGNYGATGSGVYSY
jgi:hypothetical protein